MVFQEYALFPWRTALNNVVYGLQVRKVAAAQRQQIASEFLRLVSLEQFADFYPHNLSGACVSVSQWRVRWLLIRKFC